MIDQNSQFFAILTAVGEAKQANATALGQPWTFSQMGVGDADNADPIPDRTQTRLINEWRRASVNQVRTDPANPNIIITEQVIPADVGGKWIREIALYDADGDMVAVANCAPSFKPLLVQGTGKTQIIRMNFIVANTASVVLKIDPAIVLATREYVDTQIIEALAKMDFKHSVLVATTTNTVLSGSQTIDGVLVTEGARVLVKDQVQAKDNGIYVLPASGAWKRAQDADSSAEVTPGLFVSVEKGTANSDSVWQLVTDGPITLGTTALAFEMVSGKTGVLTGTYKSVTVDKCGRVVGGTNPTTLAGHGINDAFTKTETASAVQAAIATLVGQAPAALDQLYELATAMNNDPNFATTMNNLIALKAPLANAALTGAPTAPTAALATANLQLANTLFVANALNALLTDPWALQPIGVPIPVMFGAGEPPTNKGYRYIKLTAAEAYNTGVLTGEVVTGVAPLVTAYARVNLAGSPINGNTVYLLNTERRSIRPGMGGTLQDDALQNITGKLVTGIPTFGGVSAEGVFAFTAVSGSSQTGVTGTGGVVNGMVDLTVDASRIARTSTETRVKNIGANYYMRIL